mmetsp:Transcript_21808/g.49960  ORF Transcript_21808/g.49960 Transcript_21808/m.49960 type:complete len:83 (-) Transcript_21808:75-323(-)
MSSLLEAHTEMEIATQAQSNKAFSTIRVSHSSFRLDLLVPLDKHPLTFWRALRPCMLKVLYATLPLISASHGAVQALAGSGQ